MAAVAGLQRWRTFALPRHEDDIKAKKEKGERRCQEQSRLERRCSRHYAPWNFALAELPPELVDELIIVILEHSH
jgi:hypothetical protein